VASLIGTLLRSARTATAKAPVPYIGRAQANRTMFGRPSHAGDQVRQMEAAEASAAVFSIVSRTSTATAKVEWHMHRDSRDPDAVCEQEGCDARGVELVDKHPALVVLNRPNEFFTRHALFEAGQQHMDLVGETWIVMDRVGRLPYELWPVRPDRMQVVPSRKKFIAGYIYHDPDGMEIPIRREDVLSMRMPHPMDPYRGLGPVQSVMSNVHGDAMSSQYNVNFYRNGARPGGVVTIRAGMPDDEFDQLVDRWEESHGGVHNAGRTAFLEESEYTPVPPLTLRDMQFVEGANLNRDTIMLAYTASKFDLGILEDVNRAASEAAAADFGLRLTVPRVDRWKAMLNQQFLPQFGEALSRGYELVYSNPVPSDREADRQDKSASVVSWVALVGAGVDPADASEVCDLPEMRVEKPEPKPLPGQLDDDGDDDLDDDEPPGAPENAMKWVAVAHKDKNTCEPCNALDGKTYRSLAAVRKDFHRGENGKGFAGYKNCVGARYGNKCRCTAVRRRK
jgi:HK97 family phage portal protein